MKVLFVPVKWSDSVEPIDGGSWNVESVKWLATKTRQFYLENTYGKVDMDITVSPWLTLPVTGAQASFSAIIGAATELTKIGIDAAQYERVVCFSPKTTVSGFKGSAVGKHCWVFNCMGSEYAIHSTLHELGHSFGVGHPTVLLDVAKRSGNVITMPPPSVTSGGTVRGLYDLSTVMSYDFWNPHFSGPEKCLPGWVTPTTHLGGDVTYSLTPLSVAGGACYVVKVPVTAYASGSARVYWIERREDIGAFEYKVPTNMRGILIRVAGNFGCYAPARIDATPTRPGSDYNFTSNLLPGETFTDGVLSIDCVSDGVIRIHDAGAVVVQPPVVPPPAVYPPAGKWLGTICRGVDQYGRYADGMGGETQTLMQANSPDCGYVAPVNPNYVTLAVLKPLVAAMTAGSVTQSNLDSVRALVAALKTDA